jgi:hypothetical protein
MKLKHLAGWGSIALIFCLDTSAFAEGSGPPERGKDSRDQRGKPSPPGDEGTGTGKRRDRGDHGRPGHERPDFPGRGPGMAPGQGSGDEGRMGMRKKRIEELEEKAKGGTLSDEEQAELERARKARERFEALKKKHEERGRDRAERRRFSKRDAMKRFPDFRKDPRASDEFRKHARRLAHLERAREVAAASGKDELVARIDQLIAKERARHERWLERHRAPEPKGTTP